MIKSKDFRMKQIKNFPPFILITLVTLFSLGKTLQYYFYTDDYAFLYYIGNNLNFRWPYDMVLPLFRPIYHLFGTNALPYFSLALFTYLLSSFAVYFFVNKLTAIKLVAILSALIYATGYVGVDQFSMIAVSIINNLNIINVCITLIFLIKFIETKKLKYYFLTLVLFCFSVRLFPYRAFPLMLFLPTLEFVKTFKFLSVGKMLKALTFFIIRYIPFVFAAFYFGIFSYGSNGSGGEPNRYFAYGSKILSLLNFDSFKELFAVLGRLILVKPVSDIFNFTPDRSFFALIGFIFTILTFLFGLMYLHGKNHDYGRSLIIVLFFTIEGYIGNMLLNMDFDSNGPINRYLTIAFFPFSAIMPLFLFILLEKIDRIKKIKRLNKKCIIVILIIPIIWSYAALSRTYEDYVIQNRSIPAKNFYKELKANVPKISNYTVFYFDNALYYPVPSRFGNVLLSAAMDKNVNIAMPYRVSIDLVKIVDSFDNFLRLLNNPPAGKKVSYYTFYDDEKGLHNTTEKVFKLLKNGSHTEIPDQAISYKNSQGESSINIKTTGVSSLTPLKARFNLKANPVNTSSFSFPYIGINPQNTAIIASVKDYYKKNNIQKDTIFKYLLSREKYYKTVKADVDSIHIAKQNPASYLIDDKIDTSWISDQSRWEVGIKSWVKLDLGDVRNISRLFWEQLPSRVISDFTIQTSIDGNSWKKINTIHQGRVVSDKNLIINDFDPVDARYILLNINKLVLGPGPGLSEIEAVESEFSNIDLDVVLKIRQAPFEYIKNEEELFQTYSYLRENAKLTVRTITNRDDPVSSATLYELSINLDGEFHEYSFQIPVGGTELKNIQLSVNFPANLTLSNFILENQLKEVLDMQINKKCQDFVEEKIYSNPFNCK